MKKLLLIVVSMGLFSFFAHGLETGQSLPADLSAKNQDDKVIRFADLKGQNILIFFYPKDDTPGCTKEACSLRDEYAAIKKLNTVVLGISRQDAKSHQAFKTKHKLPFDLLVDADGKIGKALGVSSYPMVGISKRQSLLVDADGKVVRFYKDVDPETHTAEVLADLKKLQEPKIH